MASTAAHARVTKEEAKQTIDVDEIVEVRLSDRHAVKIKTLGAFESIQADEIAGGGEMNAQKIDKVYAICSIREINGEAVFPLRNRVEFAALAQRISFPELLKLIYEVSQRVQASFTDDLKNVLAAQGSDS